MGGRYARNRRLRYRRRLRRDSRAVVSVVGTLLALLVFFALFGVFLTQYVPLWMTDNESTFTANAQTSMAQLKSYIDLQAALGGPPVYATPFQMASDGIPLIAQPTTATLAFTPFTPGVFANVSIGIGPGGGKPFFQNFSLGTLKMVLQNRYYIPQTFELEDGGVVQSQGDTQQVLAYPLLLQVNASGSVIGVTMSLDQLYGNASSVISTGTQEVFSHYLFSQKFTSNATGVVGGMGARFVIGTHFPCAWATFLSGALAKAGLPSGNFVLSPGSCVASNGNAVPVSLQFLHLTSFTLVVSTYQIVLGVGVE